MKTKMILGAILVALCMVEAKAASTALVKARKAEAAFEFKKAITEYDRAIDTAAKSSDNADLIVLLYNRGRLFFIVRRFKEAARDFKTMLSLKTPSEREEPDLLDYSTMLGTSLIASGKQEEGDKVFSNGIATAQRRERYGAAALLLFSHADAYLHINKDESGVRILKNGMKAAFGQGYKTMMAAQISSILLGLGESEDAKKWFSKVADKSMLSFHTQLTFQSGKYTEAFERSLSAFPARIRKQGQLRTHGTSDFACVKLLTSRSLHRGKLQEAIETWSKLEPGFQSKLKAHELRFPYQIAGFYHDLALLRLIANNVVQSRKAIQMSLKCMESDRSLIVNYLTSTDPESGLNELRELEKARVWGGYRTIARALLDYFCKRIDEEALLKACASPTPGRKTSNPFLAHYYMALKARFEKRPGDIRRHLEAAASYWTSPLSIETLSMPYLLTENSVKATWPPVQKNGAK